MHIVWENGMKTYTFWIGLRRFWKEGGEFQISKILKTQGGGVSLIPLMDFASNSHSNAYRETQS